MVLHVAAVCGLCQCMYVEPNTSAEAREFIAHGRAAFEGVVTRISPLAFRNAPPPDDFEWTPWRQVRAYEAVEFRVNRAWRGVVDSTIVLNVYLDGACDPAFELGARYFVVADSPVAWAATSRLWPDFHLPLKAMGCGSTLPWGPEAERRAALLQLSELRLRGRARTAS